MDSMGDILLKTLIGTVSKCLSHFEKIRTQVS